MAEPGVVDPKRDEEPIEPLFYPARELDMGAPLRWLAKGWSDLKAAPLQSLTYGVALVAIGYLLLYLAWSGGHTMMLFSLVTGLILMGPALAFGLYSISKQLELGLQPRVGYCVRESKTHLRNEMLFALVLLVILLVWARAATMVEIFVPVSEELGVLGWLQFFGIGSAVGAVFAAIVFTASAFSLPMMLDRGTDAITAALTSVNAVLKNKMPMLLWGGLIVALVLLGFATLMIGLAVVLPLIGHGTWHAYKEAILPDDAN